MKRASLENQIAGIINNGKVINSEEFRSWYGDDELRTIQHGTFKCTIPMKSVEDILRASRNMYRKAPQKYPEPITAKILGFLYNNKNVIPFYKQLAEGKDYYWFKNKIWQNFPDDAKRILKEAIYGNESDRKYAMSVMPVAWKKYCN